MKFTLERNDTVGNGVVPFGKYKGQPVEVLMADDGYRDWLLAQPWFRERHAQIYQLVINYGGESSETPEHNQMQAKFLDDAYCVALSDVLWQRRLSALPDWIKQWKEYLNVEAESRSICATRFEHNGWDVNFTTEPAAWDIAVKEWPACSCRPCDHTGCGVDSVCKGGDGVLRASGYSANYDAVRCDHSSCLERTSDADRAHCDADCLLSPTQGRFAFHSCLRRHGEYIERESSKTAYVELKPDLGDDYPAVLRQVLSYKAEGSSRRCVVVRRHGFEYVTWEQVKKIFTASGVHLLAESEIREQ